METWDVIKLVENQGYRHVFENTKIIVFSKEYRSVAYIKDKNIFVRKLGVTREEVDKLNNLL